MAWKIEYLKSARKSIDKLDPQTRERIRHFIYDRWRLSTTRASLGKR